MDDWRAAHKKELLEKQRHISQKLAQLREFRKLAWRWRQKMKKYSNWFNSLQASVGSSAYFSLESMIRMGSITVQLNQLVGEFEQIGDPKTMGTGTTSSEGTARMSDQKLASAATEVLSARAGPLSRMAPWELVWHIDPDTSESIRQGKNGAALVNTLCNPITTLGGMGFAKEINKQSQALFTEHPNEFKALEKGWKDTKESLDSISDTLEDFDWRHMRELEGNLEDVLRKYESTYDGARGADKTSAYMLRQAAAGKSTTR